MKYFWLTLWIAICGCSAFCQPADNTVPKRRLCISEWVREMCADDTSEYSTENLFIYFDPMRDKDKASYIVGADGKKEFEVYLQRLNVKREVKLIGFAIDGYNGVSFAVDSSHFGSNVTVSNSSFEQFVLRETTIRKTLRVSRCRFFRFTLGKDTLGNVVFETNSKRIGTESGTFTMRGCTVISPRSEGFFYKNSYNWLYEWKPLYLMVKDSEYQLIISGNTFLNDQHDNSEPPAVLFATQRNDYINFSYNTVQGNVLFKHSSINEAFSFQSNIFEGPLSLVSNNYKPVNLKFEFSELPDSLQLSYLEFVGSNKYQWINPCLKNYFDFTTISDSSIREGLLSDSRQKEIETMFFSTYANVTAGYRQLGQTENANLCYVKMKDFETLRLQFNLEDKYSFRTWFTLNLNYVLKYVSAYGTDPSRALIVSFYTMLAFAIFYFLFPSEPDNLSRTRWLPFFSTLQAYITQHVQLPELNRADQERKVQRLQQFKEGLEGARQDMPPALAWLSLPLYHSATAYYRLQGWLLRRADVLPEAWSQLSPGRKFSKGFLITTYAFLFLLWGLVVRLLNALALSLNAFVTLGYGEIQARGIARYLAVLEGVCGWFLLSIFSVSLITQLMQ